MRSTYAVLPKYIQYAGCCNSCAFHTSHWHHWISGSISQRVRDTGPQCKGDGYIVIVVVRFAFSLQAVN